MNDRCLEGKCQRNIHLISNYHSSFVYFYIHISKQNRLLKINYFLETSKCLNQGGEILNWEEQEWKNGRACRNKCNMHAKTKGTGCCEAEHRDPVDGSTASRSFCRFYALPFAISNSGISDTKASLSKGKYCTRCGETKKKALTDRFIISMGYKQIFTFQRDKVRVPKQAMLGMMQITFASPSMEIIMDQLAMCVGDIRKAVEWDGRCTG